MRKTVGFLIVLLFAQLTLVANSSAYDFHDTHLDAAYGPQLRNTTACQTCHEPHGGMGAPLLKEDACDPCHSPGGVYDGVNDPVIGAWANVATGVYSGGELAPGKEKWCVGCHDDDPSLYNGVISVPNIAGMVSDPPERLDYGYYITGHGKHGNQQAISCSACHDPALLHVDGEARTYTAAADNYQAGYRLKSVDGQAPMDVPRAGWTTTADQFRLCFSCHDSTPFLTFDNTDTNFRADVNDNCEPLDPAVEADMVNKHYHHLRSGNPFFNKWDSDFDGTTTDSQMSCPACHNVHGPKIRDSVNYPDITNAPGMIRTGELIDREQALSLRYLTGSCPDLAAYSATNELFDITGDSTGGRMQWYGGGRGWFTRNGVCIMCHNEGEPYWRVAKDIMSCGNCHT